jgi:hypothetical protein
LERESKAWTTQFCEEKRPLPVSVTLALERVLPRRIESKRPEMEVPPCHNRVGKELGHIGSGDAHL